MKNIILFIVIGIFFGQGVNSQKKCSFEIVDTIREFKNLYKYQNFYLSSQPTLEELQWLKLQGVTKIINLRTETENKDFSDNAFCEETNALALGFNYLSFPVNGATDYTPEMLADFSESLNSEELILIHCASATRVTYFFMAYLINNKGYSINDAVLIGKSLKFVFPLENLLGDEIEMKLN